MSFTPAPASAMFCSVVVRRAASGRDLPDFFDSLDWSMPSVAAVEVPFTTVPSPEEGMLKDAAVGLRGAFVPEGLECFESVMLYRKSEDAGFKDGMYVGTRKASKGRRV